MTDTQDNSEQQKQDALQKKLDALMGWRPAAPTVAMPSVNIAAGRAQVGALRGEATITIQTRQAQMLMLGREASEGRRGVTGLVQFAKWLMQISAAAKQDDPWAAWMLVRVEALLQEAENTFALMQENIQRAMGSNPMINIKLAESVEPLTMPLSFAAAHAHWVARVITSYDTTARGALTLKHYAVFDTEQIGKLLDEANKPMRRVFESLVGYRVTGVTRADVLADNQRAQEAKEALSKLGPLPQEILDGKKRARFAPAPLQPAPAPAGAGAGAGAGAVNKGAAPAAMEVEQEVDAV
jgi:integrating conjugative element protein (TIGR03761 family)